MVRERLADAGDPFPEMLREGHRWQVWLRDRFRERGFDASTDPVSCRPSLADYRHYGDAGDVRVVAASGGLRRISVKSTRTVRYSGPLDFPFDPVIVDTVRGWERQPSAAVVKISQLTKGLLVVPATSRHAWGVQTFPTPDGPKPNYVVPRRLVRSFDSLCDWLEAT